MFRTVDTPREASGSDGTAAAGAIRDQISADANCILRLQDTVDKLVGSTSGAIQRIQERAQHIIQFAAKIGVLQAGAPTIGCGGTGEYGDLPCLGAMRARPRLL